MEAVSFEDRDKPVGPDYRLRLQSVRPSVRKEPQRVNVRPSRETLKGKCFNLWWAQSVARAKKRLRLLIHADYDSSL